MRAPRGTHKIAQHRDVWPVRAYSPCVHGKPQAFREFQIHARVIKLRKTETLRRQHAIQSRRIHRPRWTVCPPRATRHFVELLPIAFVPSGHSVSLCVLLKSLDAASVQKVHQGFLLRPSGRTPLPCRSYSYTPAISRRSIFLACCIKHVTGRFVSRASQSAVEPREQRPFRRIGSRANSSRSKSIRRKNCTTPGRRASAMQREKHASAPRNLSFAQTCCSGF